MVHPDEELTKKLMEGSRRPEAGCGRRIGDGGARPELGKILGAAAIAARIGRFSTCYSRRMERRSWRSSLSPSIRRGGAGPAGRRDGTEVLRGMRVGEERAKKKRHA